ncbi:Centromere protein O [Kalmanozyma brasiliensis GHG001]|uniref:Centromere protein O n=1 Tax=Kalmanozyma brasiliensis (strain GHG001) TaxID=1365824 RepID=UPI002867E3BF|nr:Centromere protein O [Kalmanozyma brasiliensis GHG001]EST04521.2 Centromere protein O [Kalmanozyma brasiliensis GHG001]
MSSSNVAPASADELRSKLAQLRADKALLTSQLASLRALPDLAPEAGSTASAQNQELGSLLRSLEEKSILYRSSAWTCFELDLDVGRRARLARDSAAADKDGDLALGIRLDTFWRGRFHEPYYLVFARPSQLLDSMPQLAGTTVGDVEANSLADGLRLIRHTVPHFVPLGKLVEKYLPSVVGGEVSGGSGSKGRDNEAGGLTMLSQFSDLPGVHAFLSDLHCHLQAYVSRRQQAMALQQLKLPGQSEETEAALEALGTEAFDLVKVTWRVPFSSARAADPPAEDDDEESTNPTVQALKAAAKRKRENPDDEPTQHLEVVVQYDDLQSDRLVDETRPSGVLAQSSSSSRDADDVEGALQGLRMPYGQVRVQLLEYAPELETRQRRAPGISKADLKALQPKVMRREDLEETYAREHDGESLDMDEAFERIAQRVWTQLRGKSSVSESDRDWIWRTKGLRSLRKMLRPEIDPRLYRLKTPDFRALGAKYPTTFGPFVKDDGGYEAKIDFQDAQAVRCLAQTLLLDDFGVHASFSPSNLCPMIPNRLAYIALLNELLSWSLPTWRLLRHFQHQPLDSTVRGLDIGTGASVIYPALGVRCFPSWRFVATDIDRSSLEYAGKHVINHVDNGGRLSESIALVHVDAEDAFVPKLGGAKVIGGDAGVLSESGFDFIMCNPPFYLSAEEMDRSAQFKKQPANAVCHGTRSEMVTTGGEVAFVRRMIAESLTTYNVLWWTCMLGKLSSVIKLSSELKQLSKEGKMSGWGVHELPTGGGKTKRWVVMWCSAAIGMRVPDSLSREGLPSSLDRHRPSSTQRRSKVLRPGSASTRKELHDLITKILDDLEGCSVYPSAYMQLRDGDETASRAPPKTTPHPGTIDVVITQESWTRKARRAKLQPTRTAIVISDDATQEVSRPLLMARIAVTEAQTNGDTGLVLTVSWTYGMDAVKFESFAMFLLAAVERDITLPDQAD